MGTIYGFTVSGTGRTNLYSIGGGLEEHGTVTRFYPNREQMLEGAYAYYSVATVGETKMSKDAFFAAFPGSVCINTPGGQCRFDFYEQEVA